MATPKPQECSTCGSELVVIAMLIDNADMEMASCQKCDTRVWRQGGETIALAEALAEVGEHAGRRR